MAYFVSKEKQFIQLVSDGYVTISASLDEVMNRPIIIKQLIKNKFLSDKIITIDSMRGHPVLVPFRFRYHKSGLAKDLKIDYSEVMYTTDIYMK